MIRLIKRFDQSLENLLLEYETNAAGRLGLFRIIWVLFAFSIYYTRDFAALGVIHPAFWQPLGLMTMFPSLPPYQLTIFFDALFIGSLILILFGYRTQIATVTYVLAAIYIFGISHGFGKIDHSHLFVLYLPATMLFCNWGQTYSVDALLRKKQGQALPDVHDGSWRYSWSLKLILVLIAVLFVSGGYAKIVNGKWLTEADVLYNFILSSQLPDGPNFVSRIVLAIPILVLLVQIGVVIFESLWFFALSDKTWRVLFLSLSVLFHFGIYILMDIAFVVNIIVYAIFLDWQVIYKRSGVQKLVNRLNIEGLMQRYYLVVIFGVSALIFIPFVTAQRHVVQSYLFYSQANIVFTLAVPIALFSLLHSIYHLFLNFRKPIHRHS